MVPEFLKEGYEKCNNMGLWKSVINGHAFRQFRVRVEASGTERDSTAFLPPLPGGQWKNEKPAHNGNLIKVE